MDHVTCLQPALTALVVGVCVFGDYIEAIFDDFECNLPKVHGAPRRIRDEVV
jgi:hypothetical protein